MGRLREWGECFVGECFGAGRLALADGDFDGVGRDAVDQEVGLVEAEEGADEAAVLLDEIAGEEGGRGNCHGGDPGPGRDRVWWKWYSPRRCSRSVASKAIIRTRRWFDGMALAQGMDS